jgi:hypothetical protein
MIRPHAEPVDRTTSVRPFVKPVTSPPQPFTPHERNAIKPHAEQVERTASIQPSVKPSTPSAPPLKQPSASISPLPSSPAPALAKMASSRLQTPRATLPHERQVSSRGAPFESRPPGEDRGKGRPDDLGHRDFSVAPHGPPALSEHASATTEPLQRGYKDPSATPHRPPAPHPEHAENRQDRKDPSATPHQQPIPPEHTPSLKEPPRQVHKDPSATPHRPPASPELTPATTHTNRNREHGALHLPERGDSLEKAGPSLNLPPDLDIRETHITPKFVSPQNQPKRNKSSIVSHHL